MAKKAQAKKQRRPVAKKQAVKRSVKKADAAPQIADRKTVKVNEESKALFLDHHLPKVARLKDIAARAQSDLRNAYKTAKKDGFLQRDFDIAFRLRTQTGEKAIKAEMARDMTIAKWMGFKGWSKQLDLFMEQDTADIESQAYADGEEASRTAKPASPMYAPGTPGYDAYMHGFNDHQDKLTKGFKKKEEEPASGIAMTRSQFKAQQVQKAADAAEHRAPLFTKREPEQTSAAE